ncbi:MAG: cation-transporting P-type ATPase [Candidatus Bathyarchaeia archaeon]
MAGKKNSLNFLKPDLQEIIKSQPSTVFTLLMTSNQGLAEEEANRRLNIHGLNHIETIEKLSVISFSRNTLR